MAFIVKGTESTFTPAPAGTHNAVCVDVIDLGNQETMYGTKHRARFVWEIDETRPEYGDRFLVFSTVNVSLHESSTMGKLLRSWRGRDFTAEELAGFDVENVVGAPCLLSVVHNEGRDGNTYANVNSATPLPKGMTALQPSGEYVRQKDRDENSKDVRSDAYEAPAPRDHAADRPAVSGSDGPPPSEHRSMGSPRMISDMVQEADDDLPF